METHEGVFEERVFTSDSSRSRQAQMLTGFVWQIYTPDVAVVAELEESVRGAGGFGSTG